MKILLWSYIIVLILQQALSLAGLHELPLLNLRYLGNNLRCQSLSQEPSSSARVMGAAFYASIKATEYKNKIKISLKWLWQNERKLLIGFLYSMLSMQSGTAIIILLILSLSFFHWKYSIVFILFLWMIPLFQSIIESEQLDRVIKVIDALKTGDADQIIEADHSASFRILPVLNLLHLDFFDVNTWFGYGTDTGIDILLNASSARDNTAGGIQDYGLIAYVLSLLFIFRCCIRPFLSLPTLMFFVVMGAGVGNVAYAWGILMIFTVISFFYQKYNHKTERNEEDEFIKKA